RRALLGLIVAQCQGLITRRWMRNFSGRAKNVKAVKRSFFPPAMSSRISYATFAMGMRRNFSPEGHGWHSTRPARCYENARLLVLEILERGGKGQGKGEPYLLEKPIQYRVVDFNTFDHRRTVSPKVNACGRSRPGGRRQSSLAYPRHSHAHWCNPGPPIHGRR